MFFMGDIIDLARQCAKMGIIAFIFVLVLWKIGYWLLYKKILKGKKKIEAKNAFKITILGIYVFSVLYLTCFNRTVGYERKIYPFLWSYREAWIRGNEIDFRNILLNYVMFIPLGFLLPIASKRFNTWWKTYLAGLGFSLLIEVLQLTFCFGTAEGDDLISNTVGTIIGYGLYSIISLCNYGISIIINKKENNKKEIGFRIIKTSVFVSPLVCAFALFLFFYGSYNERELGYSLSEYIGRINPNNLNVVAKTDLKNEELNYETYIGPRLTSGQAHKKGKSIIEKLGKKVDDYMTQYYDQTVYLWSKGENGVIAQVDYKGGTYTLDFFSDTFEESGDGTSVPENIKKEKVIADLNKYQFLL